MMDANAMARIRIVRGADGLRYIYDPHYVLHWATHVHIPQHEDYQHTDGGLSGANQKHKRALRKAARRDLRLEQEFAEQQRLVQQPMAPHWSGFGPINLQGLGYLGATELESGAIGAATLALNFIPGVGPILSGVAALAEGLLGGSGDPTPEWQLETQVMQLREAIAVAHQQMGVADSFPIPLPDAKGPEHVPTLQDAVTEANGGPVASSNWRSGLYNAIKVYQGELQQLSQQSNNDQVVQQVLTALHQSPVLPSDPEAAAQATPPDGTGAPAQAAAASSPAAGAFNFDQEAQTYGPWVLGSAGALVVVFLLASMAGGSGKK